MGTRRLRILAGRSIRLPRKEKRTSGRDRLPRTRWRFHRFSMRRLSMAIRKGRDMRMRDTANTPWSRGTTQSEITNRDRDIHRLRFRDIPKTRKDTRRISSGIPKNHTGMARTGEAGLRNRRRIQTGTLRLLPIMPGISPQFSPAESSHAWTNSAACMKSNHAWTNNAVYMTTVEGSKTADRTTTGASTQSRAGRMTLRDTTSSILVNQRCRRNQYEAHLIPQTTMDTEHQRTHTVITPEVPRGDLLLLLPRPSNKPHRDRGHQSLAATAERERYEVSLEPMYSRAGNEPVLTFWNRLGVAVINTQRTASAQTVTNYGSNAFFSPFRPTPQPLSSPSLLFREEYPLAHHSTEVMGSRCRLTNNSSSCSNNSNSRSNMHGNSLRRRNRIGFIPRRLPNTILQCIRQRASSHMTGESRGAADPAHPMMTTTTPSGSHPQSILPMMTPVVGRRPSGTAAERRRTATTTTRNRVSTIGRQRRNGTALANNYLLAARRNRKFCRRRPLLRLRHPPATRWA